ncbi:magnesium/cobalt transporter CorA [Gimesia sp.]|uniref:magnesium/cobalt transporter CorA n=2 Tax=Gimesia TaxID=1649453 RepID=UPI0025BC862B|nr:magnesium/cobalt transporter CorA [Gimesia sp.]|tara:strand:+ start:11942 stop:13057 length:1116 start_codon:yes stop_codon:yes gene_type:complete
MSDDSFSSEPISMLDAHRNTAKKAGMPPGSLIHVADFNEEDTRISVIDYGPIDIEEPSVETVEDLLKFREKDSITWVCLEGLKNVEITELIGKYFDIHPLVLEDILNTHQRPKFEEYDDYLYIVLKGLSLGEEEAEPGEFNVDYEQISILVLNDFVFTFKEWKDELFLPLIQRIRSSTGRIRTLGSDYLTYAILDTIIDQNFVLLDSMDERIDAIEEELLTDPTSDTLVSIQRLKRELINIRRSTSPQRELLSAILRSDHDLISEKIHIYFRDVFDHVLRISESVDSYRDMLAGLLDIYVSSVSNKMNEVMKILTVFASIFIPLTFIAGIYGMNFEYMPELRWKWSYPMIWVVFITLPAVLIIYFKKKKWL